MNAEEKIALMFDIAEKQQKAVTRVISQLESTANTMKATVERSIESAIAASFANAEETALDAVQQASEPTIALIGQATQAAQKTSQRLDDAAQYLTIKLLSIIGVAALAAIACVFAVYFWLGSDIVSMRTEQLRLRENITALEAAGGKVVLGTCDGQICVRVDPNKQPYTNNATGLPMYFVK